MRSTLGWAGILVALVLAGAVGLWFGEGLGGLPGISEGVAALRVCGIAVATVRRPVPRIGAAVLALAVFVGSWVAGSWEAGKAYGASVDACEDIREELVRFRRMTGAFPAELSELEHPLPGNRILRGSVLTYSREGDGYVLQISDWLVTHWASNSDSCTAHK